MADRQSPGTGGRARSGRGTGEDATNMPGQYPTSLFGMAIPQSSGAGGNPGTLDAADSVSQVGQYPDREPISGVDLPQAASGTDGQPPGSQGRAAGDQAVDVPAQFQTVGSTIYGVTEADHAMHNEGARPDGQYPPTKETLAVKAPTSTGAGGGGVRGPGHPNAGR